MQLEIKGKPYQIKFGAKFVAAMDEKHTMNRDGATFGAGIELTAPMLFGKKITTLAEYLYMGTITEKPRPSLDAIYDFLDEAEDIEAIYDEVIRELEASNASKFFMADLRKNLEGTA